MIVNLKKLNINRFGLSFFVLAAILALIFFFFSLENFRTYRSKVTIMFIPKSETLSTHTPYVMENLIRLPKMLSFYERMLRDNSNLSDDFSGKTRDEKKEAWNEALDIKKDDGSSIINIKVSGKDKIQSAELAKQTAHTLFNTASFYYNIKSDADFRIIDGPVTVAVMKFWYWLIPLSVLLGLIVSFLLNLVLSNFSYFFSKTKNTLEMIKSQRGQDEKKFRPIQKKDVFKAASQVSEVTEKRHQAPENLPVAAEPYQFTPEDLSEIPPATENLYLENKSREISEPTEEELKKRLNQLLRGEL